MGYTKLVYRAPRSESLLFIHPRSVRVDTTSRSQVTHGSFSSQGVTPPVSVVYHQHRAWWNSDYAGCLIFWLLLPSPCCIASLGVARSAGASDHASRLNLATGHVAVIRSNSWFGYVLHPRTTAIVMNHTGGLVKRPAFCR